ncbi:flagellar biosynthesis protein FliQ [Escherichia coli]|uniref:flagellar biosynthesis protein FliQ n=1 Tax=Escherichia coli TaxID=562 RepID=UPI000BB8FD8D|nr:flagellar biosynthesis protein FliQ [Escherichia coli]
MRRLLSVAPVLLWLITPLAFAQLPGITSQPLPGGGQSWSLPVQTLVFITSLTFIPAILLMMTSFTRIIIVFGLLRNALGTPSAPPNQVLLGLALFLTFFIMSPVIDKIYVDAYQPFSEEKISMQEALALAAPLLLVALVTGLIISILQAATQINEMTLSFIPKIIAVFIAIIIAGPWMLNLLLDYVRTLFTNLPYIIG